MKRSEPFAAFALLLLAGCAGIPPAASSPPAAPSVTAAAPEAAMRAAPAPAKTQDVRADTAPTAAGKKPAAPVVAARPPATTPPPKAEGPAPLDLKVLEAQLKETRAIGLMTKLSLKNQVDDLVAQFRAYYQGELKTTLADLRRPYEMLLMKVLAVLQDGDPALARAITASREAIWGILSNREKFVQATR